MVELTSRRELLMAARAAQRNAYCVYSNFPVGAAVLTKDGRIFNGCNVENCSYPVTSCAEKSAISAAITAGCRDISAVAVIIRGQDGTPCGNCRQFLAEFNVSMDVLMYSSDSLTDGDDELKILQELEPFATYNLSNLLPHAFTPAHLVNNTKP